MPCYSEPHDYCDHSIGECIDKGSQSIIKYYKDKADEVTNLLCHLLGHLENMHFPLHGFEELRNWWERHKKFDAERNSK